MIRLLLFVGVALSSGCAGFFDLTYAISDKKRTESKQERTPTEQTVTVNEFELAQAMVDTPPVELPPSPVPAGPESRSPEPTAPEATPPEPVPLAPHAPYSPSGATAPPLATAPPHATTLPAENHAPVAPSAPAVASPRAITTLRCTTRTRAVERSWRVSKTYGYRGGWERSTYFASMAGDLVIGGIIAGVIGAVCTDDEEDTSCMHMLWASPWAIDLLYASVRQGMVRDPVLEAKSKHDAGMRLGVEPLHEEERSCEGTQLWLGVADGTSEEERITEGFVRERRFRGDPIHIPIGADGSVVFDENMARAWLASSSVALWAVQNGKEPTKVRADLCAQFQPYFSGMTTVERDSFRRRCSRLQDPQGNWVHR